MTIKIKRDSRLNRGTAQGQMSFWDATLNKWVYTETSELFWDDVNKRLGIGTDSPAYKLDVKGTAVEDAIRSDIGFDIYPVPDPISPTGVVSAGGSVDTGLHWYGVVYYTDIGKTHVIYTASQIETTAGNNTVTLTIPVSTDPRVVGRNIYRTKAGTNKFNEYFLATVANNVDTEYVDTTADADLTGDNGLVYFSPNTTSKFITVDGGQIMVADFRLTSFGVDAGKNITSGGRNTFFGYQTGSQLTIQTDNVYVGYQTGNNNTGSANTGIGGQNVLLLGGGDYNTAIGQNCLYRAYGRCNTAIGRLSMFTGGSGVSSYNVAIGESSMYRINGGDYNTALGRKSFFNISSGSYNIGLGYRSGQYETGSGKLIIDSYGRADEATQRTEAIIYGVMNDTASSQILSLGGGGNVGIGTNNPQNKLDVSGAQVIGSSYAGVNTAPTNGLLVEGNVGIGITSPTAVLHLKAGTATASTAPLKFTTGTLLTTPEDGTIEYFSNIFYLRNDDLNIDNLTASKPVWTDANKTLVSKDITPCDVVRNYITPTTQTVTTGTLTSGTVTDVQTWQDGNEVHISEVAGDPGFDILYTFENVSSFCEIFVSFYYVGPATHDCVIEIYDDTNAVWKEFFSQAGAGLSHNTRFSPFPDIPNMTNYINSSDQVKIRFYHPQSGNASHNLYIDYVSIIGDTL